MAMATTNWRSLLLAISLISVAYCACAGPVVPDSVAQLSVWEIQDALQVHHAELNSVHLAD